jgi:zinc finger protein
MSSTSDSVHNDQIFPSLNADDFEQVPTEIESLCVNCEQNGVTKLLMIKIPLYKEVILMSFHCDHCGYMNNEIQSAGKIQEQGIRYVVKICDKKDLNRQVVKSEYAGIRIPEVDFEIPSGTQPGEVTNVEGIITRTIEALSYDQEKRKILLNVQANQIDDFIVRLNRLLKAEDEFTLIVDDPSGNSYVESVSPYQIDNNVKIIHYHRTLDQDKALSLVSDDTEEPNEASSNVWDSPDAIKNEVLHFQVNCSNCKAPAETNMKFVNIPFFKEVVIMATNCAACGVRTNEVKSGGGFADKGMRITLKLENQLDLSRDVLKSETCNFAIPELEMEVGMGIIGGRFTTVEGLLNAIKEELVEHGGFAFGDSAEIIKREKMVEFLKRLSDVVELKTPAHLILDDPAGNSYVQSLTAPEPDKQLLTEYYERTFEQNESLGLNDMKTENYES